MTLVDAIIIAMVINAFLIFGKRNIIQKIKAKIVAV